MAEEPQADSRGEARQSFFAKQKLIQSTRAVFQQLSGVLKNASLYPAAHPFLLSSAEKLLKQIKDLLVMRKEVTFYLVGGELFFETNSVPIDLSLATLVEQFTNRDVGGVIFRPGLTPEEIIRFAYLMNNDAKFFADRTKVEAAMALEKISHIEIHRALLVDKKAAASIKEGKKKTEKVFIDAVDTVKGMVQSVHAEKVINMRQVNSTVQKLVDNILQNRDALIGMTSLKMYDEYTFAHSVNVSVLAISLGTYLSFEKPQVAALGVAGLMHDIGKVSVPLEIINKPDKLTEREWAMVKRHPIEGALLLADVPAMTKLAMVASFEHHQHGDVYGYPRIDNMVQQHPFSQIISIADAYDAIIAARVYYKVPTPPYQGVRILLEKRGTNFNAVLVKAFVNMVGIFPIGTVVKLDNGEVGIVMHQTSNLMRPRILILTKFDGSEKEDPSAMISLLEIEDGHPKRSIIGTIEPTGAGIDIKKYLE
ncbi:MAG: HD domain-containing protein [Nitrospirae bacterium]|nr:HD domain-containing protein [Nitrospirota bacterium]NTW65885.1 HD domain-containing protein [Nitrospirota bacterium]